MKIRHGHVERRLSLNGRLADAELSRVLDGDLRPVSLPETGIVLSQQLAEILGVNRGDEVEIEIARRRRPT